MMAENSPGPENEALLDHSKVYSSRSNSFDRRHSGLVVRSAYR